MVGPPNPYRWNSHIISPEVELIRGELLESAGLIRMEGARAGDPVRVRPVASLLNLVLEPRFQGSAEESLVNDLFELLAGLHAMGVDLLQSNRRLLPEAVYSAFLTLGLRLKGWEAEREAQHGAGRAEVKLWGHHDYQAVHEQVCAYWSDQVVVGAAVMLADGEVTAADYEQRCLAAPHLTVTRVEVKPPLRAHFLVESRTADGALARVRHLLLRIPKRAVASAQLQA